MVFCLSLCLLIPFATPIQAQTDANARPNVELVVVIFSYGPGQDDDIAVAYETETSDAEVRTDLATITRSLNLQNPEVKITRKQDENGRKNPVAEAKLSGLTNWNTGVVNLDPLLQAFRRFGHFNVRVFFMGNFPPRDVSDYYRPPLRIQARRSDNSIDYEIWVDQSRGVPGHLSAVNVGGRSPNGWQFAFSLIAIALVAGGSVYWIVQIILAQRRAEQAQRESP